MNELPVKLVFRVCAFSFEGHKIDLTPTEGNILELVVRAPAADGVPFLDLPGRTLASIKVLVHRINGKFAMLDVPLVLTFYQHTLYLRKKIRK